MKTLIIVYLSLLSTLTFSQGQILKVIGDVKVAGKVVKTGAFFRESQTLTTGSKSLALVRFSTGSTLKINENSSLRLQQRNPKKSITTFRLLKGSSFFSKDPTKIEKMNVLAKNVSMGVRGTVFFVAFGQKAEEDVYMCVHKGKVLIKGSEQKKATVVKAGKGVVVAKGKKSSTPMTLPGTESLNWNFDPNSTELINKAKIDENYQDPIQRDYD
ncbi:MAG: FecR family protein [Bacteriovoracaceae bacterium]|nr:FecR family protein [Bacteriovoracaceae bacterium]